MALFVLLMFSTASLTAGRRLVELRRRHDADAAMLTVSVPPESAFGFLSRYSVMPRISVASRTFLSIMSFGVWRIFRENAMFS